MKKNITFLLVFLLFVPAFLIAQNRPRAQARPGGGPVPVIKGKVVEAATRQPLEFATITLFRQKDSALVNGTVTDANGVFSLDARPGRFVIKIEFIGFQSVTISDLATGPRKMVLDLGEVALHIEAGLLEEVEVRAEKSTLTLALDKKVFHVGKDLANSGGTAADVLDNVPSVTVDVEGNVELRGAPGVRILVDGKPSTLVGIRNTSGLRSLPANMIDKIEVVTNPSAKYEAEGLSGIINIVLKKNRKKGINGSIDLAAGYPDNYGVTINMNFRREKLNFFTNYALRYRQSPGIGSTYQEFYSDGSTSITQNNSRRTRGGLSNNFRFGADYFFNKKNTLTTAFSYTYRTANNTNRIEYRDYLNSLSNPVGLTERTENERENRPALEYSLTYKKHFDRKNHTLTFDLRYQDNTEKESSDYVEAHFLPDEVTPSGRPDLQQRSENTEGVSNFILQADYVYPFGEKGRLEAGWRSGIRDISNDFKVEQFDDFQWIPIDQFTNTLLYSENIHAAYTTLGDKFGKVSLQAGLRAEYSDVRTELVQTREINPRNYFNLFPSLFFGYAFNEKNTLQASYSRRIRRPGYWELNPFLTFTDARHIYGGNPDLNPEFTNSFEVGYLKYLEKGSASASVYYRHTNDVIQRIREVTSDTSSSTRPRNLSTRDDYGLELTFSFDPSKKWRVNGNANFFRSQTEGAFEGLDLSADTYTWSGRLSSRWTIFKKIDVQVNFNYRAPRNTPQGHRKALWNVDPAASMDLLNNKATLTLSVRDVFNTRRYRYTTLGDNFLVEGDWQWRPRQASLTFNYRINQKKRRGGNRTRGSYEGGEGAVF